MENKKDKLIHARVAARRYGLPIKWLKEQANKGVIPALVADNQVLFDAEILASRLSDLARGEDPHSKYCQECFKGEKNER